MKNRKILLSFIVTLLAIFQLCTKAKAFDNPTDVLLYRTHVQNVGWMDVVASGEVSGTTGRSLRVEAIEFQLPDSLRSLGNMHVQTHVQNIGWQPDVTQGIAGTEGKALRLEALKIWLDGQLADQYEILYRVHVQNIGWMDWVKDGAIAGTTGRQLRVEAIQIELREKKYKDLNVSLSYSAHVQNIGWMSTVSAGSMAGTTGRSLAMEALSVNLSDDALSLGNVSVQAHVQNKGWLDNVSSGQMSGTTGQSLRLEGLKVSLTGTLAEYYDVYYRAHVSGIGWLGWAHNGDLAGSVGCNRAIEAIELQIHERGSKNAPTLSTAYTTSVKFIPRTDILLVNKKHGLSPSYAPGEDPTAGKQIRLLISKMQSLGYRVSNSYSGYRSYSYQATLYSNYVRSYGQATADTFSARPGYSEHQTGLAFDLMGWNGDLLRSTAETNWVAAHAHEFGFIVRYQAGKESITGYMAEPWHLRYIGSEAAAIYKSGKTLEEYLGQEGGGY